MDESTSDTDDVFIEGLIQQTNAQESENGTSEVLNSSEVSNTDQINANEFEENIPQDISNQKQKYLRLPFARIKHIMKLDPDCTIVSQDSIFLVTKATEMFLEFLAKESGKQMGSSKRKTVMRRDVDLAIENCGNLCFLDGALD